MKDIQFNFYYLKLPVPNLQCALFCCLWRCTWNKGLSTLCIRPSCNFHIFKLLRNHLTDFNESIQKASTLCPVPSLCFSKDDCMPCLWLVEKFFLLLRNVFQKMILNRKQILPILYVLKIFAPRWSVNKDGYPGSLIGRNIFDFSSAACKCWTDFNETLQEASTQHLSNFYAPRLLQWIEWSGAYCFCPVVNLTFNIQYNFWTVGDGD